MDVRGLFFALVLGALTVLAALVVEPFLTYLLAAMLLAFVLYPLQRRLEDIVGPTVSALVLVTAAVVAVVAITVLFAVTVPTGTAAVVESIEDAPALETVEGELERVLGTSIPVQSLLAGIPEQVGSFVTERVSGFLGFAIHSFVGLALLVFVVYYLLKDGDDFLGWLERTAPLEPEVQDRLVEEASEVTWAVVEGHALVAVVQGIVAGLGLFVVGIPNALFWTLVMIVLAFLPVIGVAAVLAPAILYLLVIGQVLRAAFLAIYGLSAVALIDDYLRAIVVDRQSSLHSAVILVGVFGGVYVFGVMGLFFGPIVLGLFTAAVTVFNEHYARS
jgi:predicted PurR-regulated permease PerM